MPWPWEPVPVPSAGITRGPESLDKQNISTKVDLIARERWPLGTEETILPQPSLTTRQG